MNKVSKAEWHAMMREAVIHRNVAMCNEEKARKLSKLPAHHSERDDKDIQRHLKNAAECRQIADMLEEHLG